MKNMTMIEMNWLYHQNGGIIWNTFYHLLRSDNIFRYWLQDGYRQLAAIPAQALKGVIRVKFVNEQVTQLIQLITNKRDEIVHITALNMWLIACIQQVKDERCAEQK